MLRLQTRWQYVRIAQAHTRTFHAALLRMNEEKWHSATATWTPTFQQKKEGTKVASTGWEYSNVDNRISNARQWLTRRESSNREKWLLLLEKYVE